MYRITVEDDFSSAHRLLKYEGKCSTLHGHNWKVRLTVRAEELDERGITIDFGILKRLLAELVDRFDHVDLNTVPPFDRINPSAENIARTIFEQAGPRLPEGVEVDMVTVWESDRNRVEYRRD